MGHMWRQFPHRLASSSQQKGQSSASALVISPLPSQPARGAGIALVFHKDASILVDLGSTFSYVSSYFARSLGTPNEFLASPVHDRVQHDDASDVTIGDDGVLRMQDRICLPNVDGLRELILEEANSSRYSIHLGAAKMYQYLREHYWRSRMKKDIVGFVAWCLNYQQVKYEHQRSGGLLQWIDILEWKWERITMDSVVRLP
ncbi:uncharacterized protein [Nicotiana sylvestris]|uniref:uncharacterized protein n=1 Tax=Nicotiana sylvestris TaxID=4096 RepID=UPI00388CC726